MNNLEHRAADYILPRPYPRPNHRHLAVVCAHRRRYDGNGVEWKLQKFHSDTYATPALVTTGLVRGHHLGERKRHLAIHPAEALPPLAGRDGVIWCAGGSS